MNTYINNSLDISKLQDSHVLFDACAIIDLVEFNARELIQELKTLGSVPCYIHQVLLEVYATNSTKERAAIQLLITEFEFQFLPTVESNMRTQANQLQERLHLVDCHPAPTDLYLGAAIHRFSSATKTYILTSNIKDFPEPIFKHIIYIPLVNNKKSKVLALIGS